MTNEQLRMQMLSGVITEGEYKTKLQEKESLNENFVGMGAINNPFADRKKETYEDAFEHFLGQKYNLNEEIDEEQAETEESFEDVSLDEEMKEPIPFKKWGDAIYDFIYDNLTNDEEEIPMVIDTLKQLISDFENK
jgi:hypothetical protein